VKMTIRNLAAFSHNSWKTFIRAENVRGDTRFAVLDVEETYGVF
jgi:hypothetical protein